MKKREHGDGGIDQRGVNVFRLRYRVSGARYSITFKGSRAEAKAELRRLIRTSDTGSHIAPDKITVGEWCDKWLALLQRKSDDDPTQRTRRRGLVTPRTAERYADLLRLHVKPTLGERLLQKLGPAEIDALYIGLEKTIAPRTAHHVHTVFTACLGAAVRKKLISTNPALDAEPPSPGESNVGNILDRDQLTALVQGFRHSALYPIVAIAAFTGARRNEILTLRWADLDEKNKTLRIARAIEETKEFGRTIKEPKTQRGIRTIQIDGELMELLLKVREKHLRIAASIPDGSPVDLSLIKLPPEVLMFPSMAGGVFDFTRLRDPHAVTREFCRQARKRGFSKLRFHDLRGSHETALLDAGVPVHVVAARCGHDPAVLLLTYAKRTKKADTDAADKIGALLKGALGNFDTLV
jgi:integrase